MSPMSNEPFCEILVFITCVSSIDSNQPAHLCSLARVCTAWTQCIYRTCKFMWPFSTCRRNYPVGFSSKCWCINVVCARIVGAYENAWMVRLIWVFTGNICNKPAHENEVLIAWVTKEGTWDPDQLRRLARAFNWSSSNHTYRTCIKAFFNSLHAGYFFVFVGVCWLFFKISFFLSVLIWIQTACISYQQKT